MSAKTGVSGRVSLSLGGKLAQLNISVLLTLAAALAIFYFSVRSSNPLIAYAGCATSLVTLAVTAIAAFRYHAKQEKRSVEGQPATFKLETASGQKLTVTNPPDTFFEENQLRSTLRSLLVGYDENLCADGEVIGPVAGENYRMYTANEKDQFVAEHRAQVRHKREEVGELIQLSNPADKPLADPPEQSV